VRVGDAIAFVPEGFWHFLKLLACVLEHHAPAMDGRLVVSQQPDVGEDTGVVKQLVGQHDDGIEPVVLQNPAADLALARATVASAESRRLLMNFEPVMGEHSVAALQLEEGAD